MLNKMLTAAVIVTACTLALPASLTPSRAAPLHPGATIGTDNFVNLVRHRRHHRNNHRSRNHRRGIGVFIVPGLYWGPAWWDSAYAKACWRDIQPCPQCAKNWAFICA
jgi:hypothetical protein